MVASDVLTSSGVGDSGACAFAVTLNRVCALTRRVKHSLVRTDTTVFVVTGAMTVAPAARPRTSLSNVQTQPTPSLRRGPRHPGVGLPNSGAAYGKIAVRRGS